MVHIDFQPNNGNNDVMFPMCSIISVHLGFISMVNLAVGFGAYSFASVPICLCSCMGFAVCQSLFEESFLILINLLFLVLIIF